MHTIVHIMGDNRRSSGDGAVYWYKIKYRPNEYNAYLPMRCLPTINYTILEISISPAVITVDYM